MGQRESGEGPKSVRGAPDSVRRRSRESHRRVQKVRGDGPERVRRGYKESREVSKKSPQRVHRESGDSPMRVRRGPKESQEKVHIECGEGLKSLRRGCRESHSGSTECYERGQRESNWVQRESAEGPERVRRQSKESQETVQ